MPEKCRSGQCMPASCSDACGADSGQCTGPSECTGENEYIVTAHECAVNQICCCGVKVCGDDSCGGFFFDIFLNKDCEPCEVCVDGDCEQDEGLCAITACDGYYKEYLYDGQPACNYTPGCDNNECAWKNSIEMCYGKFGYECTSSGLSSASPTCEADCDAETYCDERSVNGRCVKDGKVGYCDDNCECIIDETIPICIDDAWCVARYPSRPKCVLDVESEYYGVCVECLENDRPDGTSTECFNKPGFPNQYLKCSAPPQFPDPTYICMEAPCDFSSNCDEGYCCDKSSELPPSLWGIGQCQELGNIKQPYLCDP